MNAAKLAPLAKPAPDEQELKSGVRSTRDLAGALGLADGADPRWSAELPQPLLPHDPTDFQHARPAAAHPPHGEVLEAAIGETLGSSLGDRLF